MRAAYGQFLRQLQQKIAHLLTAPQMLLRVLIAQYLFL